LLCDDVVVLVVVEGFDDDDGDDGDETEAEDDDDDDAVGGGHARTAAATLTRGLIGGMVFGEVDDELDGGAAAAAAVGDGDNDGDGDDGSLVKLPIVIFFGIVLASDGDDEDGTLDDMATFGLVDPFVTDTVTALVFGDDNLFPDPVDICCVMTIIQKH
jgi:hypothetical protein